jgi:putative restriction endonuclease
VPDRVFGKIPGVREGAQFDSREEVAAARVHVPRRAGISGSQNEGADSIVISGGYEDDQDFGNEVIYTGHGGKEPGGPRQIADQTLTWGNLALILPLAIPLPCNPRAFATT